MRLVQLPTALGLLALSAGCGASSAEPTTPAQTSYDYPIGSTDIERGESVYAESCNGCHPGGQAGYGPQIQGHPEPLAEVRQIIREGKGRMPGFGEEKISGEDLEALLAYIDSIGGIKP